MTSKAQIIQVEIWEKKNVEGLRISEKAELYCKAIYAVEQRTLKTLSSVTLEVVLDRALIQSQEKFSLLTSIKVLPKGLEFSDFLKSEHFQKPNEELIHALRHLLVEILTVLGNITAGILTKPLHDELSKVVYKPLNQPEQATVTRIHSGRRNSENS